MGAIETENYVQAAGTFAGVTPPPAPIPSSGIVAQQGIQSFTRNGNGNYTLTLEQAIGFLEAEVRVLPGLNQLVVIGGQVDPDTNRIQIRSYDTFGNPADCQIFSVEILKVAVGPAGQLPIPPPPAIIVPGGSPVLPQVGPVNGPGVVPVASNTYVIYGDIAGAGLTLLGPANPNNGDEIWLRELDNSDNPVIFDGNGRNVTPWYTANVIVPTTTLAYHLLTVGYKFITAFNTWALIMSFRDSQFSPQNFVSAAVTLTPMQDVKYDGAATFPINLPANPDSGITASVTENQGSGVGVVTVNGNGNNLITAAGASAANEPLSTAFIHRKWRFDFQSNIWLAAN